MSTYSIQTPTYPAPAIVHPSRDNQINANFATSRGIRQVYATWDLDRTQAPAMVLPRMDNGQTYTDGRDGRQSYATSNANIRRNPGTPESEQSQTTTEGNTSNAPTNAAQPRRVLPRINIRTHRNPPINTIQPSSEDTRRTNFTTRFRRMRQRSYVPTGTPDQVDQPETRVFRMDGADANNNPPAAFVAVDFRLLSLLRD